MWTEQKGNQTFCIGCHIWDNIPDLHLEGRAWMVIMGRMVSPKMIYESLTPSIVTVTSFGNMAFADVINLRWGHNGWLGSWQEGNWTHAGTKKAAMWRQRPRLELCYHKPRKAWGHQKVEGARKDPLIEAAEGEWHCQHLDFRLLAPELWGNKIL